MHGKKYIYSSITYSLSINAGVFLGIVFIYLISAFGKETLSNLDKSYKMIYNNGKYINLTSALIPQMQLKIYVTILFSTSMTW